MDLSENLGYFLNKKQYYTNVYRLQSPSQIQLIKQTQPIKVYNMLNYQYSNDQENGDNQQMMYDNRRYFNNSKYPTEQNQQSYNSRGSQYNQRRNNNNYPQKQTNRRFNGQSRNPLNEQQYRYQNRGQSQQKNISRQQNRHPDQLSTATTSSFNIRPEMVIWFQYKNKFEAFQNEFRVNLQYRQNLLFLQGCAIDVSKAKLEIQQFVNHEYSMEYLWKNDNHNDTGVYRLYEKLVNNEDFIEMQKNSPNICVMTRPDFQNQMDRSQKRLGYSGCDECFSKMPKQFVIIFCRITEKEIIVKEIQCILDSYENKLEQKMISRKPNGEEISDLEKYSAISERKQIQIYDLIWLTIYFNLTKFSNKRQVYLKFTDHEEDDKVYIQIYASFRHQANSVLEFFMKENVSKWIMEKLRVQNYNEQMTLDMIEYIRNQPGHEILVYGEDEITETANNIDQAFGTKVSDYLQRSIRERDMMDKFLFLLAEKRIINDLLRNAEDFLLSKQINQVNDVNNTALTNSSIFSINPLIQLSSSIMSISVVRDESIISHNSQMSDEQEKIQSDQELVPELNHIK